MLLAGIVIFTVGCAYTQPKVVARKTEKHVVCFCNGLSLPPERQCPTMSDLD